MDEPAAGGPSESSGSESMTGPTVEADVDPTLGASADPTAEMLLDGNAAAGVLAMVFGIDITASPGRCATCHTVSMVGAMRAYVQAPGIVLRCPACSQIVIRIVQTPRATYIDARGASYLVFEREAEQR
jgi:hypothetical protein